MIFGILAGEPSGDRLGAGLMSSVRQAVGPGCRFVGIGGPLMVAEGLESIVDIDQLSVNGFKEPVKRLPSLIGILRRLLATYADLQPVAFIGIDFNVFNFILERLLKKRGVPTVHYVSPSVYAWRRGRVRSIARSTDLLLTLYPFEPAFYRQSEVEAVFVGHPLADEISLEAGVTGRDEARSQLNLHGSAPVLAVLPGSRMSEVKLMAPGFFDACEIVRKRLPEARFVVPCLHAELDAKIHDVLTQHPDLNVVTYPGNARLALTACDVALVKSGTCTLEAMLLHRPMVVSYRMGELTYQLVRRLLRTPFVALPNILAGYELVPELLQHDATAPALAENLLGQLDKLAGNADYLSKFEALHKELRQGADGRAADALLGWLASRAAIAPSIVVNNRVTD
jgi:lipid-A-disaccharide synthase